MIFSELYSVYYNTIARVLGALVSSDVTEAHIRSIIAENAFGESALAIEPAIKEARWQIIKPDFSTAIKHKPTMPLTTLQKQWLKAVLDDPRIRLFDIRVNGLDDITPLFTHNDYYVYDKYSDGDPYEDPEYIRRFRLILAAVKAKRTIKVTMNSRHGKRICFKCRPVRLEYSEKDDKFRVVASGSRYSQFNVARIHECDYCTGNTSLESKTEQDELREVILSIRNERNALERVMLHFAHFEKRAERMDDGTHTVCIRYYESDETEMLIRVLGFGPLVKVLAPASFVELIKSRLKMQKTCGLR